MGMVMKGTATVGGGGRYNYAQVETFGGIDKNGRRSENFSAFGFYHANAAAAEADLPDMIAFAETQAAKHGITIEWEERP